MADLLLKEEFPDPDLDIPLWWTKRHRLERTKVAADVHARGDRPPEEVAVRPYRDPVAAVMLEVTSRGPGWRERGDSHGTPRTRCHDPAGPHRR